MWLLLGTGAKRDIGAKALQKEAAMALGDDLGRQFGIQRCRDQGMRTGRAGSQGPGCCMIYRMQYLQWIVAALKIVLSRLSLICIGTRVGAGVCSSSDYFDIRFQ